MVIQHGYSKGFFKRIIQHSHSIRAFSTVIQRGHQKQSQIADKQTAVAMPRPRYNNSPSA
tara:strand:- start:596 stop:775 length:180 start_codon:yes stop_codon:yes gene_type:complete